MATGYKLGQFNRSPYATDNGNDFMKAYSPASGYRVHRQKQEEDLNVTGTSQDVFADETITVEGEKFTVDKVYYFHGQIKRLKETQVFTVKLIDTTGDGISDSAEQYIRTIKVAGDSSSTHFEWVDVEFLFKPMATFNSIMFQLTRTTSDYRNKRRYPCIIFQEISVVQNLLEAGSLVGASPLVKLGVQSRPGMTMCINKEEIKMSRTGIYEVKNGLVLVDFFSVVGAGIESDVTRTERRISEDAPPYYVNESESSSIFEEKKKISDYINRYEFEEEHPYDALKEADVEAMKDPLKGDSDTDTHYTSIQFCDYKNAPDQQHPIYRTHNIDAFTLDYMYSSKD